MHLGVFYFIATKSYEADRLVQTRGAMVIRKAIFKSLRGSTCPSQAELRTPCSVLSTGHASGLRPPRGPHMLQLSSLLGDALTAALSERGLPLYYRG